MNLCRILGFFIITLLASCTQVGNDVVISDAWVRATAPGQEVGAAYMTLQSTRDITLIKTESAAAGSVEIHSMTMSNGVMKMRKMDTLPLSAGKPAKLEPGGFHLMLFDLKKPLKAGEQVEFALHFKDNAGKTSEMKLSVPIKADD
ncbi:MAG TPA: copper chaperone PCu(A)C [Methylophilaceae bacterium]|nr:copper chaperone PCu(A)C [Methylophilaceae bacterium]